MTSAKLDNGCLFAGLHLGLIMKFVSNLYSEHHVRNDRLGGSVEASKRLELINSWVGGREKVIDLGGRDGTLSGPLAFDHDLTIFDADRNALNLAEKSYGVKTVLGDLNAPLPFDDESFEVALMGEVIEHLPYPQQTLLEVNRILGAGGILVGSLPLAYHLQDRLRVLVGQKLSAARDPTHLQFFRFQEFMALLKNCGFACNSWVAIKGGAIAKAAPGLFARNIAFLASRE